MTKDNSTGKNKDFYELGKKMFDRLNPQIAHNPEVVGYVAPQREWVGLTDEDKQDWIKCMPWPPEPGHIMVLIEGIESELKELNR